MTPCPDLEDELTPLLRELVELRKAVSRSLGRDGYLFGVLDEAIETRHGAHLRQALDEYRLQPDDVRELVTAAAAG